MVKLATQGEVLARFGHALSDPTRARLLLVLRKGPSYPTELAEILGVGRTNLSNHLACLRGCGLVVAVSEGRRLRYELAEQALAHALDDLLSVVLTVDPDHAHTEDQGADGPGDTADVAPDVADAAVGAVRADERAGQLTPQRVGEP